MVIGRRTQVQRNCRWSLMFSPTAGRWRRRRCPATAGAAASPMPESSSSCGDWIAPAQSDRPRARRARGAARRLSCIRRRSQRCLRRVRATRPLACSISQVRAPARRAQVRDRRAPAPAPVRGLLEVAHAFVARHVVVGRLRDAQIPARLHESVRERVVLAHLAVRNAQGARLSASRLARGFVVFHAPEVRQPNRKNPSRPAPRRASASYSRGSPQT